jgi:hypothetical protein
MSRSRPSNVLLALVAVTAASAAHAAGVKKECVEASTIGQTRRDEEKLLEAREKMLLCARDQCPSVVRSHCARWLTDIEAQIPSVVVRVLDADGSDRVDAKATMDGKPLNLDGKPVMVDPGEHVIAVEAPDAPRKEQKVLLVDREKSRLLNIQLPSKKKADAAVVNASATPTPARRIPTGAWIVGGVGLAGLASAAYFGLAARKQLDVLKNGCSPDCTDAQTKPGRTDAVIADVSLGVGLAGVVGALLWVAFAPPSGSAPQSGLSDFTVRPVAGGWVTSASVVY